MSTNAIQSSHIYSTYFAPRGRSRIYTLGMQIAQLYLSPFDQIIGFIGEAGSGKSVLYEAHGAARMLYAYGILGQQYLSGCWTTIAITAPFSNNRSGVVRLTKLCTDQQLEPIHILDVIHDFMDLETRPF